MSKNKIEKIYKKKKMIIPSGEEDIDLNEEDIKYEIYEITLVSLYVISAFTVILLLII